MTRYLKLAPLVFFLCACLLLLVGCAKAPADQVKEGQSLLASEPAQALEHAQSVIDKLRTEPARPERDKMLVDARLLKIEALGSLSTEKAMSEFEAFDKESPGRVNGQVLWGLAVQMSGQGGDGQNTAVMLLDQGIKRFPESAAQYKGLIDNIKRNPNSGGSHALKKLVATTAWPMSAETTFRSAPAASSELQEVRQQSWGADVRMPRRTPEARPARAEQTPCDPGRPMSLSG
jgi:hypothetical protein